MRKKAERSDFKNLINIPKCVGRLYENEHLKGWKDTGEGGIDVYAIILEPDVGEKPFSKCCAGSPIWGVQDVVLSPSKFVILNNELCDKNSDYVATANVNLAILIGTSSEAPNNGNVYYTGKTEDLTDVGKALFEIIKSSSGVYPDIVTLLDT